MFLKVPTRKQLSGKDLIGAEKEIRESVGEKLKVLENVCL